MSEFTGSVTVQMIMSKLNKIDIQLFFQTTDVSPAVSLITMESKVDLCKLDFERLHVGHTFNTDYFHVKNVAGS